METAILVMLIVLSVLVLGLFGVIVWTLAQMRVVEKVGQDVARLHGVLTVPRMRGAFGEQMLEQLLQQVLPPSSYARQYTFRSGARVDAAIFLSEGIVPVDSKFPLEQFRAIYAANNDNERERARSRFIGACKKHIDDIARKYILPEECGFDFALMYIPAEGVYYELLSLEDEEGSLAQYAMQERVVPVSPSTFYAYLSVIVLGLRGMYVEKHAREVIDKITALERQFSLLEGDFGTLDGHLRNATAKWGDIRDNVSEIEKDLRSITGKI